MPFVTPRLAQYIQRSTVAGAYTDTAYYIPAADNTNLDAYGQPTASTTETQIACSFTDKPNVERWREFDLGEINAEIRFSALTPTKGARIRVEIRFATDLESFNTFEIIGIQDRGAFGYVCALKVVTI